MQAFSTYVSTIVIVIAGAVGLVSCRQGDEPIIKTSRDDGKVNVTIDTEAMKKETEEAVEASKRAGRRALDETGEALQKAGQAIEERSQNDE
jgi:hypothetical protein